MKCESCNVAINSEFKHAIKNNNCPACGSGIMKQDTLSAYLSLLELLNNNISNNGINTETIASLIIANFEIKQLFKEELSKIDEEGIIEVEEDPDAEYKEKQKEEVKDILKLQQMRDEALDEALTERYNVVEDEGVLLSPNDNSLDGLGEMLGRQDDFDNPKNISSAESKVRRSE